MAKGFFNGLLAGGIIGAVALMLMSPQKKHMMSPRMLRKSKKVRARANKIAIQVSDGVKDIGSILKK